MDTSMSDDDLEITDVIPNNRRRDRNLALRRRVSDDSEEQEDRPLRQRDRHYEGEKVEWSEEDDEEAVRKFKNRKTIERKNAAASGKKRSNVAEADESRKSSKKRKDRTKATKKAGREYGDESDDAATNNLLPEHIQGRRAAFERRTQALKHFGLKLPPTYDDIEFSDNDKIDQLRERPQFPKAEPSAPYKDIQLPYSLGIIPASIAQWLREYQIQGTVFLHKLFVYQTGGILGDDMGLGKTVQVIAFLTAAFGKTGDERDAKRMRKMRRQGASWYPRVIVVCPGTLIENWKAEFQRWGWWHVDVYHGDTKEAALQAAAAGRLEIMITTYTTYRMNKSAINMVEWDCVVADECHIIKGRKSETTEAMNEINALCRIGLTGTAIQNSYDELWTLLNWTNPGRFGPISTWKNSISDPLKMGQSHDATVYQLSKARKTAKKLVENLLPQFFLRRMKTLIAHQLPKKSDRVVFSPLTEVQAQAYVKLLKGPIIECIKNSSNQCDCGSGKKAGWCCHTHVGEVRWQSFVFPAIANLQKLSNHLALLIPRGSDLPEKQEKDLKLLMTAVPGQWQELYRDRDSILNFSNPDFCGKWKVLKKLLRFWHGNGDKVLIFSHSVRLLKILQTLFNHTSYNVSYLDGAISYEDRAKVVDDFNSDPGQFVFLISTKAGGVGLNITSANKVVIVDPNWNPAYDLQAQDRAYRIGQVRDVEVFRLISVGTIEEIVYARQIYKQQQANIGYTASTERRYFKGVQEKTDQKGEIFGLANLFAYKDAVVLRDIVNKTNVAESKAGVEIADLFSQDKQPDPNVVGEEDLLAADNDNEMAAMSQLAAMIASEDSEKKPKTVKKKSDPITAILASAGVEYTHENSEVVGSSKVEAHLSKRAEEAGNNPEVIERPVFAKEDDENGNSRPTHRDANTRIDWQYRPPADVMKRQFCTMARTFGFADATAFALAVEGLTQAQRRNCLDRFYQGRRESLLKEHKAKEKENEFKTESDGEEGFEILGD